MTCRACSDPSGKVSLHGVSDGHLRQASGRPVGSPIRDELITLAMAGCQIMAPPGCVRSMPFAIERWVTTEVED
jgi:hypothetical protein